MRKIKAILALSIMLTISMTIFNSSWSLSQHSSSVHTEEYTSQYWWTKNETITNWTTLFDAHTGAPYNGNYGSIGHSYLYNLTIWMFTCGNSSGTKSLWDGDMHGSEDPGSMILWDLVNWLFNGSSEANDTLSKSFIMFVPIVDMDTYNRCNKDTDWTEAQPNSTGVNLNRNFDGGPWEKSGVGSQYEYSGPYADSEPETQAIENLFTNATYKPTYYVNLHAGEDINALYVNGTSDKGSLSLDTSMRTESIAESMNITPYPTTLRNITQCKGYAMSSAAVHGVNSSWLIECLPPEDCGPGFHNDTTLDLLQNVYCPKLIAMLRAMNEHVQPTFGMKMKVDGVFWYWPNASTSGTVQYIKVEESFTNDNASADNGGKSNMTAYPFDFPDNKVDGKDIAKEAVYFGACESDPNNPLYPWTNKTYMADIDSRGNSLRAIEGRDMAWTASRFGTGATDWYNTNMTDIYVKFYFNSGPAEVFLVDSNGWLKVPANSGDIGSFRVYYTTGEQRVGAFVTFWE